MAELASPKIRAYQCMFVLYPESQAEQIAYCMENFPCAWALHDQDTYEQDAKDGSYKAGDLKKPHYHFVCRFPNQRYFSGIAKELGLSANVINRCNNLYKAYVYLWHANDPDEFQYDPAIVGMHDFEPPAEGGSLGAEEETQVKALLDAPFEDFTTTAQLARWAFDSGCWATFKTSYAIWRDIRAEIRTKRESPCFGSNIQHPDNSMPGYQPTSFPGMGTFPGKDD